MIFGGHQKRNSSIYGQKRKRSTFRHLHKAQNTSNGCLKPLLKSSPQAPNNWEQGCAAWEANWVSTGLVNGAISLDDHAILAERERKQHMAKNA
jgi:hypothetical protein